MNAIHLARKFILVGALVPAALAATPTASMAGIFISVNFGPPALPVYVQPPCPAEGYLWTPGYWGYASSGYYWIPGAWVQPPNPGLLWTPPYWGYAGSGYGFHPGYWGPRVGFYGGINYGFGYAGSGFGGGYWAGRNFLYNRAVNNVNVNVIHNTYVRNVTVNNYNTTRVSYNGGPNGIQARPSVTELQAAREQHFAATSSQQAHFAAAQQNRAQYASENNGHPATLATNRSGFGYRNEVNTRQGNQQSRISSGIRNGSITPGEQNHLENRDNSIHSEAQSERRANGGYLSGAERQQINNRQNRVSNSIYRDKHNANNDAAAGARHGATAGQERGQARYNHNQERPRGPGQDRR